VTPFPEVVLGVRCGWQQFIEDVVCTVYRTLENNRSSASSTIVPRLSSQTPTDQIEQLDEGRSRRDGRQQTSKSPTTLEQGEL